MLGRRAGGWGHAVVAGAGGRLEEKRRAQVGAYEELEVIRLEEGMPTTRFTRLIGVPERSYRRWQQREREGRPVKGPWPAPAQDRIEPVAVEYADRFPAWAHRKVAMLMRIDAHHAPDSTVLRALKRTGRVLPVDYQAERRHLAKARRTSIWSWHPTCRRMTSPTLK